MKLIAGLLVILSFTMVILTWNEPSSLPWIIALIGWIPHVDK
jgi:hypothetical protein